MKTLLVVGREDSPRIEYLQDLLKDYFDFEIVNSLDDFSRSTKNNYYNYACIFLDNPSKMDNAQDYIALVERKNSYMLSQPIILLTDEENASNDEDYLGGVVYGLIKQGASLKIVLTRIQNSAKLADSASFDDFSKILKNLPALIYLKDTEGHYAFSSQHWNHFYNDDDPNWTVRGKTDLDIRKDKRNAILAMENDKKIIKTGKGISYVIKEEYDDGKVEFLRVFKEPIKNGKNEVTGIIALIVNVTEQEILKKQLKMKSITDPLTGLYNRLFLKELASTFMGKGGTIITADCDGLKEINDKFGHSAGDQYLLFATQLFKDVLPNNSFIFRIGGDEFLALLPGVNGQHAKNYVDLIMSSAKNYHNDHFALEISAGSYSTTAKSHFPMEKCIIKSDQNMYKAKEQRRALKQKKTKRAKREK